MLREHRHQLSTIPAAPLDPHCLSVQRPRSLLPGRFESNAATNPAVLTPSRWSFLRPGGLPVLLFYISAPNPSDFPAQRPSTPFRPMFEFERNATSSVLTLTLPTPRPGCFKFIFSSLHPTFPTFPRSAQAISASRSLLRKYSFYGARVFYVALHISAPSSSDLLAQCPRTSLVTSFQDASRATPPPNLHVLALGTFFE